MAASGIKLKTLPAVTVTTAGTPVALYTSNLMVYEVLVIALDAGTHYIGDSTVSASNGAPIGEDGDYMIAPPSKGPDQFNIKDIYVDSSANGSEFRVLCWIRE